jgi:hypothetical protein
MDTEDIMELSEKMSAISAGYKNGVVLQAALNVCAMVIVNTYDNREEVDRAAGQLAVRLVARSLIGRCCAHGVSLRSPWQQNAVLTAKRKPARRSFQPVGALISILNYDCHTTAFLGTSTVVLFVGQHA